VVGARAGPPEAQCSFCDTDFVGTDGPGGGKFASAGELAGAVEAIWGEGKAGRLVVITGGEPMLQLDSGPGRGASRARVRVAVETNGTLRRVIGGVDWICVSPKAGPRSFSEAATS
jgi:7-carboxy-7-deazaguanine synthase